MIEAGGRIVQETRLFDPDTGTTRSMRSKEDAHDYRYFPDPDLLPLVLEDDFIAECRASLPELPDAKRHRYESALGLSPYSAGVLTAEVETVRWFEALLAETAKAQAKPAAEVAKQVSNWLVSEFFGALNKLGKGLETSPIDPAGAAELLGLIGNATISGTIAKQVLEKMLATGDAASAIVERDELKQTSDTGAIDAAVYAVLAANADKVEQYRGGKEALFGFFVGQTMKAMQGKGNPGLVNAAIKAKQGRGQRRTGDIASGARRGRGCRPWKACWPISATARSMCRRARRCPTDRSSPATKSRSSAFYRGKHRGLARLPIAGDVGEGYSRTD